MTIQIVMMVVVLNATTRGTIQFAMAVVIHKRGRSLDDSACDDHHAGT